MSTLLTIVGLMACWALEFPATAQTVSHTSGKPKSAQGQKVPMRHDQLTLYPHGRRMAIHAPGSISRRRSTIFLWAYSGGEARSELIFYIITVWVYCAAEDNRFAIE
jgi:hypothetical protein